MKPIVAWLTGIAAFVVLLLVLGGFERPVVFAVTGVMVIALVAGFIFARRRR